MLVVGNRHSYSDVCQGNDIRQARVGIIGFDRSIGVVRCYAGTTIYQIIRATGCIPYVVPGTGWATIGGCIANDVHGKNHRMAGSFGNHVLRIQLVRSTGHPFVLRPGEGLFDATIGGLGLTGEIEWADIRVKQHNPFALPVLFPLDYIPYYWRIYKALGCWQYHCVVPDYAVKALMKEVTQFPFLILKKKFGAIPSVGMLSFCRQGTSVSMDFAVKDDEMRGRLDSVVMSCEGAVYPAKTDMSPEAFRYSFPRWKGFKRHVDPAFSSFFSWRVGLTSD